MALRLRGLRPLRSARTVGNMSLRSARTVGRGAGRLMRERDFPTSVRPERRPKAGVEGPAMAAHDASTPRPAAAALSANGWEYVATLGANGWEGCRSLDARTGFSHLRSP